jgi:hypothetical protein
VAFPTDPLDVMTELQIGGTWTDITADTYLRDRITTTWGRADEAARPDPSSAKITFNNRLGRYSPRNPLSPYYGLIGRNSAVRVSVPGSPRLDLPGTDGVYASTPDASALHIVGDLDVRIEVEIDWHSPGDPQTLIGRWGTTAANQSWLLRVTGGQLELDWTNSVDSVQYFAVAPVPDELPAHAAVRATLDITGTSGYTAALYWAPTIAGPWTQFHTETFGDNTAILPGTADLRIAQFDNTTTPNGHPLAGSVYAAQVLNGINGTAVANPVFTAKAVGTTSFTDSAGRAWTITGTAITDRDYRFTGEVSSWPPRWDVSGNDRYVPVEAAGPLRRYGAGTDPLQSTLRRRIPSEPTVLAYWPMEDGTETTQAASGLNGGSPAAFTGVTWASDSSLAGSSPLPTTGSTATLTCPVPAPTGTPAGWHVEFVYRIDTAPASTTPFMNVRLTGDTYRELQITLNGSTFGYAFTDKSGNPVTGSLMAAPNAIGQWCRFIAHGTQNGASVDIHLAVVTVGGTGYQSNFSYAGTRGNVARVYNTFATALQGIRIGHLAVFTTPGTLIYNDADSGFDGEQAGQRISRLCAEEGVPVIFTHGIGPTAAMGPQRPAAFLDLLGECADADIGILHEARNRLALAYRTRVSLYNQAATLALDYAVDGQVAPPLEPVDDDQATRNRITAARTNGSSVTVQQDTGPVSVQSPPNGIGPTAPGGGTYNVNTDEQLPHMAGWLLHLGTVDAARYPSVHVDLAAAPSLTAAATDADAGDCVTIAHPPPEAGGVGDLLDLLAQGYTEVLGTSDWDLTFNCTPGASWRVAVLDDPVLGRLDTSGAQLAAGVSATATTLSVQTPGKPWITTAGRPGNFPFDITVAGEVMTVTGITSATSPQTFTVTRSVNGVVKSQAAGAAVQVATPMTLGL